MAGNTFDDEGDVESAGEDSALTGLAAVAPQAAAAAAAIDKAGDLVDGAEDAGKWVGGVLDDVFGGDEHPGQSTFDVDPNAVPESDAEYAAKMARAEEAMDKAGADFDKSVHLWNGRHQDVEHAVQDSDAADIRWASRKARAGQVQEAGTEVRGGAFDDPRVEKISQSDPHVVVSGDPVLDVDQLPTADHSPADVPLGSDVELNPQPIPPGKAAAPALDVDDSSIIIVGGKRSGRRAKDIGPGTTG
ncbi:MAG: hypothetical protein ACXWDJ_12825 [Aeromicrobium sp.]